ncbi:hypothetical protein Vafri_17001 [Volvox africanus]|uniref:Protein kinase domain-containing protein n=1 Tax=Volvox africanus TaxID=51714 RepID=A0A8J4BPF7_9CHLO|nr:hypothetical protein Vafri_17001 [Volvox africanus]
MGPVRYYVFYCVPGRFFYYAVFRSWPLSFHGGVPFPGPPFLDLCRFVPCPPAVSADGMPSRSDRKLTLGDKVTLTLRWVVLFDLFTDVSSGASAELITDMPTGTTGMLILQHAAYFTELCYPASTVIDYLGRSIRPSSFPGTNKYNATSSIPSSLKAMGGGLGSFNSLGDSVSDSGSGAVSCMNNILAPPMRRCWGHVAYIEDFAIAGGVFDVGRLYVKNGYFVHIKDAYMLCGHVLDITCVNTLTPYGCLKAIQNPPSISSIREPAPAVKTEGSIASSPQSAGGYPISPSQNNRGRDSTTVVLASVLAAGFGLVALAVIVAIFVVKRLRQRRRQQASVEAVTNEEFGAKNMTGEDGDNGPGGENSSVTSRRTPAAEGSDGRDGGEGGGGNVTAAVAVEGAAAVAAAAAEPRPNNIGCGYARSHIVVHRASHENVGGPPPSSDIPPLDGEAGRTARTLHGYASSSEQQQPQQQQQQDDGGDLPYRPVVVTPFTPFRPDLQLYQNIEQEVTLLPVVRGKGSYGKVCEGMYGGQRVAVKLVRDVFDGTGHNASDKVATTFAQEVAVLGRCQHPNVVRLLAACVQRPRLCLVMELMEMSLQRLVFGGPTKRLLPLPKVLHIGCEIARAMEYLHPTIVHRDLKPDNVLISNSESPDPIVKVSVNAIVCGVLRTCLQVCVLGVFSLIQEGGAFIKI